MFRLSDQPAKLRDRMLEYYQRPYEIERQRLIAEKALGQQVAIIGREVSAVLARVRTLRVMATPLAKPDRQTPASDRV
jgi:hypothetical protein